MSDSDTVSMTGSPCLQPYISSSHQVQVTFRSTSGYGIFFASFRSIANIAFHLLMLLTIVYNIFLIFVTISCSLLFKDLLPLLFTKLNWI